MKYKLLISFLLSSKILLAQSFVEAPFQGVSNGSTVFADIDGDNDQDVLITGWNGNATTAKLFINDGLGNYRLKENTPFLGVDYSSVALTDIDGDQDQDLFITGQNITDEIAFISKLYTNDGSGNFSEKSNTSFVNVAAGAVAFTDIDGDQDFDLIITGLNEEEIPVTKLYSNNGEGDFSEKSGTPFENVYFSSIAFSDVDGDQDQDVLISGLNSLNSIVSKLYINDGAGNFTENSQSYIEELYASSIAFADVDGDQDQDFFISGLNETDSPLSRLYINDGSGKFSESNETSVDNVGYGNITFADVDGDQDQDLLVNGLNDENIPISKLYVNNGSGEFSGKNDINLQGTYFNSATAFADVDGDSDLDLLISGTDGTIRYANLYKNDGQANYSVNLSRNVQFVSFGSVNFADIDNDKDMDVILTGRNNTTEQITTIYTNDGLGNLIEVEEDFKGVEAGSTTFADIDADEDLDFFVTGIDGSAEPVAALYSNDGSGNFNEVFDIPFTGAQLGKTEFLDIDNDGDEDLVISGADSFEDNYYTKLYKNDGSGIFSEVSNTPFDNIGGFFAKADVDGDDDLDLFVSGVSMSVSKLYINDGNGNFSEKLNSPFQELSFSSSDIADIDNDKDQDIIIAGLSNDDNIVAKLYVNDGSANFTEVSGTTITGVAAGTTSFIDLDNDEDQDLVITGINNSNSLVAKIYSNDGEGNFVEVGGTPFNGVYYSAVDFADVNGDQYLDLIVLGSTRREDFRNFTTATLYLNTSATAQKSNQTIAFAEIEDVYTNEENITLQASATSGLPVYFNILEGESMASLDGNIVNLSGEPGQVIIQANQPGNEFYNPAAPVNQSFDVLNLTTLDNHISGDLQYYPNPTSGELNVNIKNNYFGIVNMKVLDLMGKAHIQNKTFKNENEFHYNLNLTHLADGLYLLEMSLGNKKSIFRIRKN